TIAGTGDPATPTETPIPIRFSNARFLPRWNDKGLVSECALFFQVQLRPSGRMIKINKQNSFSLATQDSRIEFSELDCRYKFDKKFFGKPIRLKLPASAPLTLFPQLRQRLTLIKTGLHLNARFEIPDHTTLELIRGECILQALTPAVAVSDTFNQNFHRISQNMSTSFSFNPTSIINAFPDSVDYIFNYTIPREKHLRFAQGVLINEPQRSFLAIPVQVPVTLSLSFIWEIRDSIRVDLKPLSLPLTLNVSTLELLSEKKVSFDYTLFNQTNINGRIFGLAATTKQKSMLNGLTPEQITPQSLGGCKKTSSENHDNVIQDLIPIFGYHGIILPGRGQTNPAAITLDEAMVRQITDSDSLFIRWNFLLPPTKADCLIDTDYIAVDAGISLEGTQSIGESNR
ncbi:MAG: hypothetical protein JW795_06705, partial [Chitinivibrionales bacterium]|nr:hypothetical protein [Chitinivibrionales bacterium]